MDTERVWEALAKLKAEHFPELQIDVFFEREEVVQPVENDNSSCRSEPTETETSIGGSG